MAHTDTLNGSIDNRLDITGERCPMTYVRVRLALDRMQSGQVLQIELRGEEPARNVPRSASEQGHEILKVAEGPAGSIVLWIRKR